MRFILASSGHIAGIINLPGSKNAAYWTTKAGPTTAKTPKEWRAHAERYEGQPQRAGVPFHGRADHNMTTFGFDGLSGTITSKNR